MGATNLKSETKTLMDKRAALEAEMNAIIERLCQPGGPGLSGNLVDSEAIILLHWLQYSIGFSGFPRSDIDIPTVRADRRRLSELRNDHKDITEKINQNIELLHSARLAPTSSTKDSDSSPVDAIGSASMNDGLLNDSSSAMDVDIIVSIPFALVDEIADASPASEDGLQLGDQIVKFGSVESGENLLARLASEAQTNQGHPIPVVVVRQGAHVNLAVTPRTWRGRGLLGCHFRIL
ncbi:Nas2, N-terminal [Dillenia turbinata]|uniref:Nas2, N-terminal n=1 Tax=Dillenia turbinata TaxID=194707 RepID=A0AAN8W0X0_9MAGN